VCVCVCMFAGCDEHFAASARAAAGEEAPHGLRALSKNARTHLADEGGDPNRRHS